jgi:maleate isomerase
LAIDADRLAPPSRYFSQQRLRLGTITPSGNTVVERVTLGILRHFPQVSAHFSRTSVHGDRDPYPHSYDFDDMLAAAELLSHAKLDLICWNGSKGGSIDFALDRELCSRIVKLTGARTTTSTLAIDEVLKARGVTKFALLSPYRESYQRRIIDTFAREGYTCVAEAHASLADNYSFSTIAAEDIRAMAREVARARPEAIVTFCTNFPAAPLAAELEQELGVAVYDSVAVAVWKSLRLLGIDTSPAREWGSVFA